MGSKIKMWRQMTRRCRACRGKFSKYHSAYTKRPIDLKIWIYLSLATFYNLKKFQFFWKTPAHKFVSWRGLTLRRIRSKKNIFLKTLGPIFRCNKPVRNFAFLMCPLLGVYPMNGNFENVTNNIQSNIRNKHHSILWPS